MEDLHSSMVTVYTPASQMRTPGLLVRSMWRDLAASRELSWRLFIRDLSAQYRQSVLGVLWTFAPPIVTSLIFIVLQSKRVISFGETDIPYPVYVLVGAILWQVFAESLQAPLKSVTAAKPMLAKINFPREALIVSAIFSVLFAMLIRLVVILGALVIFQFPVTWGFLLAFLPVLMLLLLGICVGLLLTPFGMLYADVGTSLPVVTQLLFFVTPVVYPPPQFFPLSLITKLNPVSPLLVGARDLITKGTIELSAPLLTVGGMTVLFLLLGWAVYRVALPIVIERMSA